MTKKQLKMNKHRWMIDGWLDIWRGGVYLLHLDSRTKDKRIKEFYLGSL